MGGKTDYVQPYVKDPTLRSRVQVFMLFDHDIDVVSLARVLRSNGIVDTEAWPPRSPQDSNRLWACTFPAVEPDDITALTQCIEWVVERLH